MVDYGNRLRSMMEKELMFSEDKQDIEILELVVGGISYKLTLMMLRR